VEENGASGARPGSLRRRSGGRRRGERGGGGEQGGGPGEDPGSQRDSFPIFGKAIIPRVSVFIGGSAMSMAKDIAEGYIIVSEHTFKKFQPPDLQSFLAEVDKLMREIRGVMPPPEDMDALQRKNRKLQRLNQAQTIVNAFRTKFRR